MPNDLCDILIRFRLHTIALVADIEKAFHQLGLQKSQRDVTRFIWLKKHNVSTVDKDNIQEYRFCRVLFGATIKTHLDSYNDELTNKLRKDIYIDNLITGTNTAKEAVKLYHTAKTIFKDASMNLWEWVSNSEEVNQVIDSGDITTSDTMNVLGYTWDIKNDYTFL